MSRIISVGTIVQKTFFLQKFNSAGTTSFFESATQQIGGNGFNSAVTFSRFGHETTLLSSIGNDLTGETALAALDQEGINTAFISISKGATSCKTIIPNSKKPTIFAFDGVNSSSKSLNLSAITSTKPEWLYISSLDGDLDFWSQLIEKAKKQKCQIMLNPSEKELLTPSKFLNLLPEVDILYLTKKEASKLVPGTILSELASHLRNYTKTIIITDGSAGGFATNSEESFRFGTYSDIYPKDLSGTEDAFGSGFLAALASGQSFRKSLTFGSANATSVSLRIGPTDGILTGNEKLHEMPIQKVEL